MEKITEKIDGDIVVIFREISGRKITAKYHKIYKSIEDASKWIRFKVRGKGVTSVTGTVINLDKLTETDYYINRDNPDEIKFYKERKSAPVVGLFTYYYYYYDDPDTIKTDIVNYFNSKDDADSFLKLELRNTHLEKIRGCVIQKGERIAFDIDRKDYDESANII